jgi:serine phosphatase RsbU (regulator of sigma subunit)
VAQVAYPGLIETGDSYLVEQFAGGALVAVIDGLGHGPKAAIPAQLAVETLKANPQSAPEVLIERCHRALRSTRGAVVSIASIDTTTRTMVWLGVGNVTGILLRGEPNADPARVYLHLRGGIVGYNLPSLRQFSVTVQEGDTLILATDGVRSGFVEDIPLGMRPQQLADHLLEHYQRETDDTLVLVARFMTSRAP